MIKRETISAMPAGNAKFLMDSVFELSQRINRFKLADAEIGLFSSVVIIAAGKIRCPFIELLFILSRTYIIGSSNVNIFLIDGL